MTTINFENWNWKLKKLIMYYTLVKKQFQSISSQNQFMQDRLMNMWLSASCETLFLCKSLLVMIKLVAVFMLFCLYVSLAFAHGQTFHCIPLKYTHDNLSGGIWSLSPSWTWCCRQDIFYLCYIYIKVSSWALCFIFPILWRYITRYFDRNQLQLGTIKNFLRNLQLLCSILAV